jgi:HAD superfamily hydrolase (TIGR01509 family)
MAIEIVLFDLGGVLIELSSLQAMGRFLGSDSEEEVWRRWLTCPWVRRFERGHCDADEFARGMVETWSMSTSPEVFLEAFVAWPRGLMPGARELARAARSRVTIGCLSNTNALHAERHASEEAVYELFDHRFLSHEIGLVKPDREIYEHVLAELGCPASKVLFLDDNQINVDGARAEGLHAERARGTGEARAALARHGLALP